MYDNNSKGISYTAGFFMLIAFVIAGIVFASMINEQIWIHMTGKTAEAMASKHFEASDAKAYRMMHIIYHVVGFFLPTFIAAFVLHRKPIQLIGYVPGFKMNQLVLVILISILGVFASDGLSWVNHIIPVSDAWRILSDKLEQEYNQQAAAIIELDRPMDFVISLFYMALLPAICEETMFRGGLQNFLTRATKSPWVSIIIVSLIFSAVHSSYYGFLSRFFMGMILGLLYYYSGKMWPNILMHFLYNGAGITQLYIYKQSGKPIAEAMNEGKPQWWHLLAIPILLGLIYFYKRVSATGKRSTV